MMTSRDANSRRIPKAVRQPVPELQDFLKPYHGLFRRQEPHWNVT